MKILVSDFDKTLFNGYDILEENLKRIEYLRQKGNLFVIATGRTLHSFMEKTHGYEPFCDYYILANGAVILDNNLKIFKAATLDKKTVSLIMKRVEKYQSIYVKKIFDVWGNDLTTLTSPVAKIHFLAKDYSETDAIYKDIKENFPDVQIYISANTYINIEIGSIEANKAVAINSIIQKENITKDNVYTIGNAINDIEMISEFDGYGMSHSEKEVLDITNKLYDYVYNLIEDLIL